MKAIFYIFNVLCIMGLIFSMMDQQLLEEVGKKSILAIVMITSAYDFANGNYITAVLLVFLCILICSEKIRKLVCQGEEEKGIAYNITSTVFVILSIAVYMHNLVVMVQSIGGLLRQLYNAVI